MDVLETIKKLEKIIKTQEKNVSDLQIKFEELKKLHLTNFSSQLTPFENDHKKLINDHTQAQNINVGLQKQMDEIISKLPSLQEIMAAPKDKTHSEMIKRMNQNSVEYEKLKELLHSPTWPAAVDPSLICDITSDQDKQDRAEGILDIIIDVHLENLRFLDFGCGEGHVVMKALDQQPAFSVGYEIQKFDRWNEWPKNEKSLLTTDWTEVEKNKPYNVILIFDVLDHMTESDEQIIAKLKEIKSLMAPNGKVYVRCHPWCSVHGTHLYKQINKGWVHLVFDDYELEEMGYKNENIRKIIHPGMVYGDWFNKSGFKIDFSNVSKKPVPAFFNQEMIATRIKSRWKESPDQNLKEGKAMPHDQMEQEFVDYVLK